MSPADQRARRNACPGPRLPRLCSDDSRTGTASSAVNILAPPKARLSIEVVHDLVCPWCFLGHAAAVAHAAPPPGPAVRADLAAVPAEPRHAARRNGTPRLRGPQVRRRGPGTAALCHDCARSAAPKACCSASTASAARHPRSMRTGWCATPAGYGRADALVEALFSAHFTDGRDIGDVAVLTAIAAACGLDGAAVRRFLRRRRRHRRDPCREPAGAPAGDQRRTVLRRCRPARDRRRTGAGGHRAPARRRRGGSRRAVRRTVMAGLGPATHVLYYASLRVAGTIADARPSCACTPPLRAAEPAVVAAPARQSGSRSPPTLN